jgi:hypothetical protein
MSDYYTKILLKFCKEYPIQNDQNFEISRNSLISYLNGEVIDDNSLPIHKSFVKTCRSFCKQYTNTSDWIHF